MATNKLFDIEQEVDTIIVTAQGDLRELDCEQIEQESQTIVALVDGPSMRNIVIDLRQTDYCGSTAWVCSLHFGGTRVSKTGN